MLFLVIVMIAGAAVLLGRTMMGRWLNHLSLYSAGFGISLAAYATGLINYHPISAESWVILASAAVALYLGSAAVLFSHRQTNAESNLLVDMRSLRWAIFVLAGCGIVAVIVQAQQTIHEFGSLTDALLKSAVQVYALRMRGGLGGEPYLIFVSLAACALSGAYAALRGRLTVPGLLPFAVLVAQGILSMQRAGLVIAGIVFVFAYAYSPKPQAAKFGAAFKWTVVAVGIAVLGLFFLVGGHRGMYAEWPGETAELVRLSNYWPDLPSDFVYISSPGPTLTQYVEHPELAPKGLFASYTLQSLYRLLSKVGFQTNVPYYPAFVHSPVEANQGTYLAYVYSDFGGFGVVMVPFLAGALTTLLARRVEERPRLGELMLFAHLMLCMTFAFTWYVVGLTYFAVSMIVSTTVGFYLDFTARRNYSEVDFPVRA